MAQKKKKITIWIIVGLGTILAFLYIADIVDYAIGSILMLVGTFIIVYVLGKEQDKEDDSEQPNLDL
jgi:putative Mn2+ efflux pump MntP